VVPYLDQTNMDYEDYTPDSTRVIKSGLAYRLLGHDYATYYQYAIYVSLPSSPPPPPAPPARHVQPRGPPRKNSRRLKNDSRMRV
jgi:hypothetical protein